MLPPFFARVEMKVIDEKVARTLATDYSQYEKMVAPLYERIQENTHEQKRPRIEQAEKGQHR
jgi:hypothetical protein